MREFEALWAGMVDRFKSELSQSAKAIFEGIESENARDAFRIMRSFARLADDKDAPDFAVSVTSFARRLGITYQAVCKIRARFIEMGILRLTQAAVLNRKAARFQWLLEDR